MEESFRNRVILILSLLALIFFIGTVHSCSNARQQKFGRNKEMAARLDLEEKLSKLVQEKNIVDTKLAAVSKDLEAEKTSCESAKKLLVQEQLVNQSLKEEIEKVVKLKEALEEQLKDVLVKNSSLTESIKKNKK